MGCVQNGGDPETVAADNINSLAMVFAAIESAEKGKQVNIEAEAEVWFVPETGV